MSLQEEVNDYLDALREEGSVNMFGAVPYVVEEFGVNKYDARDLVKKWMKTFAERHSQ